MGLFTRRQGKVATIAAMSEFSEDDREHGMDMLQDAESVFVDLGAPSRLATSVFAAVMASMNIDDNSPTYGVAAGASQLGYACRMSDDIHELPGGLAAAIISQLVLDADGSVDYDRMAEDFDRFSTLVEYTATLADDPGAIATLAGATDGAWRAFATTATFQLHRSLVNNGLPKRALPSHEVIENLLRLGYALRLVDEVSGERPIDKEHDPIESRDRYLDARRKAAVLNVSDEPVEDSGDTASSEHGTGDEIDVDEWLSSSTIFATNEFEPYVERILELGTLERLGIMRTVDFIMGKRPKPKNITDSVVTAMGNARFGYAMRNREIQIFEYEDTDGGDPLAELFDERSQGIAGVNMAMINAVIFDVLRLRYKGGPDKLYAITSGTTPEIRRQALVQWADEHYPGEDPTVGFDITVDLLEYGYFLHRLIELRPQILAD